MRIGFTATRRLPTGPVVARILAALNPKTDVLITGGCEGGDTEVAVQGMALGFKVHTILPANHSQVDPLWREHCTSFFQMPDGSTYKDRNQAIVNASHRMFGIAAWPESDPRSGRGCGTWQTIRLAAKARVPIEVHVVSLLS